MNVSRRQLAAVTTYSILVVLLLISIAHCRRKRSAAEAAAVNLQKCRQLAEQIETLKAAPTQSSLRRQSSQDVALKIERAAQIAETHLAAIVRINPQAAHRLGKSSYVQQPTNVEIGQVSTKQLAKLLQELSSAESGLQTTSLHLTAPRVPPDDQERETWTVEVVLTHVFFSPE